MENLKINWVKDIDDYIEKGLADGFDELEGQWVKFIVGYDEDDEMDLIGYISCDADIRKINEDDLWEAFYDYFE